MSAPGLPVLAGLLVLAVVLGATPCPAQAPPLAPLPALGESQPIVTFEDAILVLGPSEETELRTRPQESLPRETYFRWKGQITTMQSAQGPYTEHLDPFRGSRRLQGWQFMVFLCLEPPGPFAFRDVRKAFCELEEGREVEVIGRYSGVIQVEMPYQELLTLPLLDNCYVR